MNAVLPQELIDAIIDCLVDDRCALLVCSEVCTSFRARSRAHIFSDVTLCSSETCAQLMLAIQDEPSIALLVKKLEIIDPIPHNPRHYRDDTWIAKDTLLPQLITRFSAQLESFSLTSEGYHFGGNDYTHVFRWANASDELQRAVTNALASPSIRHVELAGWLINSCQTLFSLLNGSPLRRLSLPAFWHDTEDCLVATQLKTGTSPRLHFLSAILSDCLVNYLLHPLCALDLGELAEFAIKVPTSCSKTTRSAAARILPRSLEKLTLEENIYFGDIPDVFSLARCENLKSIHLVTRIYTMDNSYWTYVTRMLESIPASNRLKEVVMELELVSTINPNDVSEWLDWTALEAVLALPTMAELERANVMLNVWGHTTTSNSVEKWIGTKGLPNLEKKGIMVGMRHRRT